MLAPTIHDPPIDTVLEHAGSWFLNSGIQDPSGGVARYYLSDSRRNAPVSTEITGYAVSTLVYLAEVLGQERYLNAAQRAARYLLDHAWNEKSATFPFETAVNGGPAYAYFFDCGIIARGLLAIWRLTGEDEYFDRARECGLSMAFDFMAEEAMHPILRLPEKKAVPYGQRWSRRPGCYQLKSAMAWRELADITGHREMSSAFDRMLNYSLTTQAVFLPGDPDEHQVMDRLHPYAYFLEGLLDVANRPECRPVIASGIARLSSHLHRIAPDFARSDVYAQLLRIRLFADRLGVCPLDRTRASQEAASLCEFQVNGPDRAVSGGFLFGRERGNGMPFVNPVSTGFALQALAMWREYEDGALRTPTISLI